MFKHRFVLFVLTIICCLLALPASAVSDDAQAIGLTNQVQERYRQFWSLEFSFDQTSISSGRLRLGRGTAVFYRDQAKSKKEKSGAVMRWDYLAPTVQTITNDGHELAIYTPEEKQVLITPSADIESDPSYALFVGTSQLSDTFSVSNGDSQFFMNDTPKDWTPVLLVPRQSHPQISRIQVWIDKNLEIRRLLMEDHFASLTELTFLNTRSNGLPNQDPNQRQRLLDLKLAPDTEVIRQ